MHEAIKAMAPLVIAGGLGGLDWMRQPAIRLPAKGPNDPLLYATLHALSEASVGHISSTGNVYVLVPNDQVVAPLDLAALDTLRDLGWIEYPDAERVQVSDKGRYWLGRYYHENRLRTRDYR